LVKKWRISLHEWDPPFETIESPVIVEGSDELLCGGDEGDGYEYDDNINVNDINVDGDNNNMMNIDNSVEKFKKNEDEDDDLKSPVDFRILRNNLCDNLFKPVKMVDQNLACSQMDQIPSTTPHSKITNKKLSLFSIPYTPGNINFHIQPE
jgi:hypothetical protein